MRKYRVVFPDLNGALRGKIITEHFFDTTVPLRMPRSALVADIEGDEVKSLPDFHITDGDTDMLLYPDETTLVDLPYMDNYSQIIVDVLAADKTPLEVSPRQALKNVLKLYAEQSYTIKVSSELEFYIVNPDMSQLSTQDIESPYADMTTLSRYQSFIDEVSTAIDTIGLMTEAVLSEAGRGQFEITFSPEDPLFMADRTVYYKQLVKEIAIKHGYNATFMAKPFVNDEGSGGHIHMSLYQHDTNIFNEAARLEAFVAGQLRYMRVLSSIFAPNVNSYRRWSDGHGYATPVVGVKEEARDTAIRLLGVDENRRIEHRVSGADANIYLVYAAILRAGLKGLNEKWNYTTPGVETELGESLPDNFKTALELFNTDDVKDLLGEDIVRVYYQSKNQEFVKFSGSTVDKERAVYGQQI